MVNLSHFSYKTLQQIKAEEFEHFFTQAKENYAPYLNHLGEVVWMTPEDAEKQHEFYDYQETGFSRLKRKLHTPRPINFDHLPEQEKELRLLIRQCLEKNYLNGSHAEPADSLSCERAGDINLDEIENIPITIDTYKSIFNWNKTLLAVIAILVFAVVFGIGYGLGTRQNSIYSLDVKTNIKGAAVFVNGEKKGYADFEKKLTNLRPGEYRIELRKRGYFAKPAMLNIGAGSNATNALFIAMNPVDNSGQGFLKISANHRDAKIFIDDEFFGELENMPAMPLNEGDHVVFVEKKGFRATPQKQWVSISAGDTSEAGFTFTPVFTRKTANTGALPSLKGLITISSNAVGGDIYLNGKNTGKESDHVFTELPFGEYRISLKREGYVCVPEERLITLSADHSSEDVSFELKKEFEQVAITTNPPTARVFIDGKLYGKGGYNGMLKTGSHELSFGDIIGFKTPKTRTINIIPNKPLELAIEYFPQLNLVAEVNSTGNIRTNNCEIINGFTLKNRAFASSQEAGPEVIFHEKLESYVWKMGFAFPYRNPKGNDALRINFSLPMEYQPGQDFVLHLSAVASEERYPQTSSRKSDIRIKVNGKNLNVDYTSKKLEAAGALEEKQWNIGKYLRAGFNTVEISTTDQNTTYFFIKKISFEN